MTTRHVRLLVAVTAVALLASIMPVSRAGARAPERRLPPSDRDDIAAIFDPLLAPLGMVTTRALLQRTDTYEPDPAGRHLAVYVEPTGAYSDAQFVEGFLNVVRVYLPTVFKRWKGLRSFDVCQEPVPGVDDSTTPPPVTQLLVNRRTSRGVDWADATLATVLELAAEHQDDSGEFTLYIDATLKDQPAYEAALAEADGAGSSSNDLYQR